MAQTVKQVRPGFVSELIAAWGFVQRNYYLTKRYALWELVWFIYTTANAMSIGYIGKGVGVANTNVDTARLTTFLLVGAMLWSYLSMLFDILSETVSWERWEGTIEYTFMSPASRATHLIGTGIYAIIYGLIRTAIMFVAISLLFDLKIPDPNYPAAMLVLAVCSISLVGFGMCAAVMPLLSPEKGQQVTMIFGAFLLLISGIYYPVDVLPGWMQALAKVSPVTYALEGVRSALMDGSGIGDVWPQIWPLLIIGAVCVPLGFWVFHTGEIYAKRTGRLKRSG